jgi:hypothetical protein
MAQRTTGLLVLCVLLSCAALAQSESQFIEVLVMRVMPGKHAQFEMAAKKLASANRQSGGDTWTAFETFYGAQNTIYFESRRQNYAAIDEAQRAFMRALRNAYGPDGAARLLDDLQSCLSSSSRELRKIRWDLSRNMPTDPSEKIRSAAQGHWVRTGTIRVNPAAVADFEGTFRILKQATENSTKLSFLASEALAGQDAASIYYFENYRPSLSDYDVSMKTWKDLLSPEDLQRYQSTIKNDQLNVETSISRALPELSSPPADVVAADPRFWGSAQSDASSKPGGHRAGKQ